MNIIEQLENQMTDLDTLSFGAYRPDYVNDWCDLLRRGLKECTTQDQTTLFKYIAYKAFLVQDTMFVIDVCADCLGIADIEQTMSELGNQGYVDAFEGDKGELVAVVPYLQHEEPYDLLHRITFTLEDIESR